MVALLLLVLSIGLVDSLNPSTIGPALYLATGRNAHADLVAFIAGVFGVYLVGGLVLTLGPGKAIRAALPDPGPRATHQIELALGLAALALAGVLWLTRRRVAGHVARYPIRGGRSSFLVGAGVMALELPTAVPYFAAIAAIVASKTSIATEIALLVVFNLAFVAPLLGILSVRRITGERGDRWLESLRVKLDRYAGIVVPAVVLLLAIALLIVGAVGLIGT